MTTLVEFFRARLDEDEQAANEAVAGPWIVADGQPWLSEFCVFGQSPYNPERITHVANTELNGEKWRENRNHIARHDPARVLREVEGKRRLIQRYERAMAASESVVAFVNGQDDGYRQACLDAIRDAAEEFDAHPDYLGEWRP